MSNFASYRDRYDSLRFERGDDGVLVVRLQTDGGPLQWSLTAHAELPAAFRDIAEDLDNRAVVLTGTGDTFSGPQVKLGGHPLFPERPSVELAERVAREGKALLLNFLDIEVPVIAAVNGPAWRHSEVPLLADIVLAADTACFQDCAHFQGGLVPGDGVHVVYPALMGMNRARYFLLTGQILSATQAHQFGLVAEVLAPEQLHERALTLARDIAAKPASLVRLSRNVLVERLRRDLHEMLGYGLYVEMLALMDRPSPKD